MCHYLCHSYRNKFQRFRVYNQRFTSKIGHYLCDSCGTEFIRFSALALKISIWSQKLVIICATRAGANLGVLVSKLSVLRQKLVIVCTTRSEANLIDLAFKIIVFKNLSLFVRKKIKCFCDEGSKVDHFFKFIFVVNFSSRINAFSDFFQMFMKDKYGFIHS